MFVKVKHNKVERYPYTTGQLRRDNPNVSFPRKIPEGVMRRYGMYPVTMGEVPEYNTLTQKIVKAIRPTRNVIRLMTEEDATDPITNEVNADLVGTPLYGNKWVLEYEVVDLTEEEITANAEKAAQDVRKQRDKLLAATDWRVIKAYETGSNIPAEWELYRQALRDITTQEGFPHTVTWPEEPTA